MNILPTKFPFFKAQNCCTSKTGDWRSRSEYQSRYFASLMLFIDFKELNDTHISADQIIIAQY